MSEDQNTDVPAQEPDTEIECPNCGLTVGFHLNTLIEAAQERNIIVPKPDSKIPKGLPIFFKNKYNTDNCVGISHYEDGALVVSLFDGYSLTRDQIFKHFGNITFVPIVTDKPSSEGARYSSFKITTYSIDFKTPPDFVEDDNSGIPQQ